MSRSFVKSIGYDALRFVCRIIGVAYFGIRCWGRRLVPREGAVLVCANHQSFLDPVLIGLTCDRRLNYLARESLFRVALLRWLIQFLDAIPIDRDGMGLAGIRESLRRIRRGEMVLIFPEGTRTYDGDVAPLKSGFCVLARRGKASLLPVGIDGAFDAWPRTVMLPRPSQIRVCVGEPISPAWIKEASDEELVAELEQRIRKCHQQARKARKTPEKR